MGILPSGRPEQRNADHKQRGIKEMIAKAILRYVRTSPSKARLVIDLVRGKTVEEAHFILDNTNKGVCPVIKKVLNSAFSNANLDKQEKYLTKEVFISRIKADVGPMLQRYRAATMGRATAIRHRTAHIYIELDKVADTKPANKGKARSK